jgi:hypothetical protein
LNRFKKTKLATPAKASTTAITMNAIDQATVITYSSASSNSPLPTVGEQAREHDLRLLIVELDEIANARLLEHLRADAGVPRRVRGRETD